MGNIKQINIKNRTYYFFNDMTNIKSFNSSLLKIDKKSYKDIDVFYIRYTTILNAGDYENFHSVNPLYLINGEVGGYIECNIRTVLEKYTELWVRIKNLIEGVNDKPGEYGKDFMKIKFNSDDNLPLNKILKLHKLTIVVRSLSEEEDKCYPQVFSDEFLYEV